MMPFAILWLGSSLGFWLWAQRLLVNYIGANSSSRHLLQERRRLSADPTVAGPLKMANISLAAHRALFVPDPDPELDLLRRKTRIAVVSAYAWLPLGMIPIGSGLAVLDGLRQSITQGTPFGAWPALFLLIYSFAIASGVVDYYRRAGEVSATWWRFRLAGALGGLIVFLMLATSTP